MATLNQSEVDSALDSGNLWVRMSSGRFWKLRRNGRTQTWKTRFGRFRITVKAGLKETGAIYHTSNVGRTLDCDFIISDRDPNGVR